MRKFASHIVSIAASAALAVSLCPVLPALADFAQASSSQAVSGTALETPYEALQPAAQSAASQVADGSSSSVPEDGIVPIPSDSSAYEDGELIVVLDDSVSSAGSQKAADSVKEDAVDAIESIESADAQVAETVVDSTAVDGSILKVEVGEGEDLEAAQAEIAEQPGVVFVQPNFKYSLMANNVTAVTDDIDLDKQYYIGTRTKYYFGVNATGAWLRLANSRSGGTGQSTVAVMDTGCLVDHNDLKGNVLTGLMRNMVTDSKPGVLGGPNENDDDNYHGTHVCGIIGGIANNKYGIAGVSYNAQVLPIKVLDAKGTGNTCDIVRGYDYILSLKEQGLLSDLHVVNLSLGMYLDNGDELESSEDYLLGDRITKALDKYDIVTVCAGGNGINGQAITTKSFPSDYVDSVSVTSLNAKGQNSVFSDYNEYKDISAPGESIYSTFGPSQKSYRWSSGTSMASPIVASVLALLWKDNPNLTANEALEAIYKTAAPVDTTVRNRGKATGSRGCVDALAALDYAQRFSAEKRTDISGRLMLSVSKQSWTGKAVKPAPVVSYAGKQLVCNRDYVLEYRNNVNPGTATIVVRGRGGYKGTQRVSFAIVKSSTVKTASATAANTTTSAAKASTAKKTAALPAKVKNFSKVKTAGVKAKAKKKRKAQVTFKKTVNATGYVIAFQKKGAKKWTSVPVKTTSVTFSKLAKGKTYRFKVRPYITWNKKNYYGTWSSVKTVKAMR